MSPLGRLAAVMASALAGMASGAGRGASLVILSYHRVLADPDPLLPNEPCADEFADQMALLAKAFVVLPLEDAVARLHQGTLPPRALCITFDDGYSNNLQIAQPILAQYELPATVFVAPGFGSGGRMFNDTIIEAIRRAPDHIDLTTLDLGRYHFTGPQSRRAAIAQLIDRLKYLPHEARVDRAESVPLALGIDLPTNLMMTPDEVREAHRRGLTIGAHTVSHPILGSLDCATAESEIVRSKQWLEAIISAPVSLFAYPNGRPNRDYSSAHAAMVRRAGFSCAVSTAWGAADGQSDPFQLPRVALWDRNPLKRTARLLRAYRQRSYERALD